MKGCITALAALFFLVFLEVVLPDRLIGTGIEDFEGNERRMASKAFFHGPELYGSDFLEIGDYNGPPLVLGWHVKSVEECQAPPPGEKIEKDSYQAYAGASARIGAYSLFGIPRGEMEVTCGGRRQWESSF